MLMWAMGREVSRRHGKRWLSVVRGQARRLAYYYNDTVVLLGSDAISVRVSISVSNDRSDVYASAQIRGNGSICDPRRVMPDLQSRVTS